MSAASSPALRFKLPLRRVLREVLVLEATRRALASAGHVVAAQLPRPAAGTADPGHRVTGEFSTALGGNTHCFSRDSRDRTVSLWWHSGITE